MRESNASKSKSGTPAGRVFSAGLTDPGKTRDHNEDAFALCDALGLYVVADGMGGAQAGGLASSLVVQALPAQVASQPKRCGTGGGPEGMAECLRASIETLNREMYEQSRQVSHLRGMGATVVVCLVRGTAAAIAHMGDSRAYLLRGGALERLTEDHALVEMLLKMGQITKAEARTHPGRNVVTRYVGMEGDVGPDVGLVELEDGDLLLLCSDGLTKMLSERTIGETLWNVPDIEAACECLVRAANDAGGADNITVLLIRYGEAPDEKDAGQQVKVRRAVGRSMKQVAVGPEEQQDIRAGDYQEEVH